MHCLKNCLLAPWAEKMNTILRCDWLTEGARWRYPARSGLPTVSQKKKVFSSILSTSSRNFFHWLREEVNMAGYWPRFFTRVWTSTSSQSTNTQKKNLAKMQPSWPHTWSLTIYIYITPVSLLNSRCLLSFEHPPWQHFRASTMHSIQCQYLWRQMCHEM